MASYFGPYMRLVFGFRNDFRGFVARHAALYEKARRSGDHRAVAEAYYAMMSPLIEACYGPSWHFVPPEYLGQSREDAQRGLQRRIASCLELGPGRRALDLGCGVGGALRGIAEHSGAEVVGITLTENEVREGNRLCRDAGLEAVCSLHQGELDKQPFPDASFDAAYAIYSLKYFSDLAPVLAEVARVLRPGGHFASYCLLRSSRYDPTNPIHARVLGDLEYCTGMPPLRTVDELVESASAVGLSCVGRSELEGDGAWYYELVRTPFLPWLTSSALVGRVYGLLERVRLLPAGWTRFDEIFVRGVMRHMIEGGRMGILTGSSLVTFKKS